MRLVAVQRAQSVDQTQMGVMIMISMISNKSIQPFNVNITSSNRSTQETGGAGKFDSTYIRSIEDERPQY